MGRVQRAIGNNSPSQSIENNLAAKHLASSTLVLYDVSSSPNEGKTCPLARYGYNRDGKRGKLQIVFGLICDAEGCPIAIEVFEGNTADPTTLTNQIAKLKERFGIAKIIFPLSITFWQVSPRSTSSLVSRECHSPLVGGRDWVYLFGV